MKTQKAGLFDLQVTQTWQGNTGVAADLLNVQKDFDELTDWHKVSKMTSSRWVPKFHSV